MVRAAGLEPASLTAKDSKSFVSISSSTLAMGFDPSFKLFAEVRVSLLYNAIGVDQTGFGEARW
jgi:hypothetical protein